jgi:hypothetical protein
MAETNSVARSLHDLGLAAWFGGSLMGAVGLNGASEEVDAPTKRAQVADAGWARWTPVNAAGIAAHLLGDLGILRANRGRVSGQRGVAGWTVAKTVVTATALAATAYSLVLGQRVMSEGAVPVESGVKPSAETPADVANAQQQLRMLQWAIPALTGALLAMSARMGEQQRPAEVSQGVFRRLRTGSKA